MLMNESNEELYDRIESIVYILTERELADEYRGDTNILEKELHDLITNAVGETISEQ